MSMKKVELLPKTVEKRVNLFFRLLCVAERRALPGAPFFCFCCECVASLWRVRGKVLFYSPRCNPSFT